MLLVWDQFTISLQCTTASEKQKCTSIKATPSWWEWLSELQTTPSINVEQYFNIRTYGDYYLSTFNIHAFQSIYTQYFTYVLGPYGDMAADSSLVFENNYSNFFTFHPICWYSIYRSVKSNGWIALEKGKMDIFGICISDLCSQMICEANDISTAVRGRSEMMSVHRYSGLKE